MTHARVGACCAAQALAALLTFRRPEVTISSDTGALEEHSPELREPLPLALHHLPIIISFAFFDSVGELVVQDATADEEEASQGVMTVRARVCVRVVGSAATARLRGC